MRLRFTRFFCFLMALAVSGGCSDKKSDSDLQGFADIVGAMPNPDGTFSVTCKNGTTEKVQATQLAQACESAPALTVANPAVEIKTNGYDYCARYSDDSLSCWNTSDAYSYIQKRPAFLGNKAKSIDMQYASACAVSSEGAVICWGSNDSGVLNPLASLASPGAAKKVAVGADAACAITKDDSVSCWGTAAFSKATAVPSDLGAVADLVAINYSFCAVRTDGTVKCWGAVTDTWTKSIPADLANVKSFHSNAYDGSCALLKDGSVRCWGEPSNPSSPLTKVPAGSLQGITQMSISGFNACAVRPNSAPICWGGSVDPSFIPADLKSASYIALGNDSQCAIQNGEVLCWKFDENKKLIKLPLTETHQAQYLVAKEGAVCSLDKDGRRVCWGRNYYGEWINEQLSDIFSIDSSVSGAIEANSQSIALGADHSCFLQSGFLQCRGSNSAGQGYLYEPVDDGDNLGLVAGNSHNCSLRTDGSVKCWGENSKGQVLVPRDLQTVKAVQAGGDHTCAVTQEGKVRCWGANDFGQTVVPSNLTNVSTIALGQRHSCAVTSAGGVTCWGDNSQKQLDAPAFGQAVQSIAAGSNHSCAILQDKSVRCWGSNTQGESSTPSSLKGANAVAAGNGFTCAINSADNNVQCWGDNTYGQLEVPGASLVGKRLNNAIGDRIFSYGDYAPLFTQDKYTPSVYNPVYQDAFAYQGLKGADGENLAYDLSVSYKLDCDTFDQVTRVGLGLINAGSPMSGKFSEASKKENVLVFPNLSGPARLIPATLHPSSPAKTFSATGVQAAAGKDCTFYIMNVAIKPAQNIDSVLRSQAGALVKQLEESFAKWLKARAVDDIRKDGVLKSKENLSAKKVRIINETLNILFTNNISPRTFGINSDDWTESDVENGLFSELSSILLFQDEEKNMDWEDVRMGRPQAEWPNWAKGFFSISLDALGKSAGEYIGESLGTYNELLEQLKGTVTPLVNLKDAEAELKAKVSKSRLFLKSTSEVRATIAGEIKILQNAANKSSDVCKKSGVSASVQQCQ